MWLRDISITNFRKFSEFRTELSESVNIILGPNASGKTTLIEAIQYFSTFSPIKPFDMDKDLIKFGESFSIIKSHVIDDKGYENELVVSLQLDQVIKKKVKLNQENSSFQKISSLLKTVTFLVEDFYIVIGSPSYRRKILDNLVISIYPEMLGTKIQYKKLVKQKNQLIKKIIDSKSTEDIDLIKAYNAKISELAYKIFQKRVEATKFISQFLKERLGNVSVKYKTNIYDALKDNYHSVESIRNLLDSNIEKELKLGKSLYGIHLDDMVIISDEFKNEARLFLSQGQIRIISILVKLGIASFIEGKTGKKCILLIDDILGELDEANKKSILKELLSTGNQTVFAFFSDDYLKLFESNYKVIKI